MRSGSGPDSKPRSAWRWTPSPDASSVAREKWSVAADAVVSAAFSQVDSSSVTSVSEGLDRVLTCGRAPARRRAAPRRASSSPRTASQRSPEGVVWAATVGGIAEGSTPKSATERAAASTARWPIRMPTWPGRGPRRMGRSSAIVSNPSRAVISAEAARSASVGSGARIRAAPRRSGTPSPFSSRRRCPRSNSVARWKGGGVGGCWAAAEWWGSRMARAARVPSTRPRVRCITIANDISLGWGART